MIQNQLVRAALGRVGFVGELYDARNESFSSRTIFQRDRLPNLIRKTDVNRMEVDYKFTENLSERFNLFNIEGELQLCVLFGLINVEGSGKFLKEDKKTFNSVSCSLMCKFETVCEKLFVSLNEYIKYIDLSLLKSNQYTHLVTDINWGANYILNLEADFESDIKKSEIQGSLQGEFEKIVALLRPNGKCNLKYQNCSSQLLSNIKISVNADIVPDGEMPVSVESFCNLIYKLPDLLKRSNDGKGKPLKYTMIPLSVLREMAEVDIKLDNMIQKIDEAFLISTICCFEDISILKLKISDWMELLKENKKYVSKVHLSEARKHYESLQQRESSLKELLTENWVPVRAGSKSLRDLVREVEKFKSHKLQLFQFEEYLESCSEVLEVINAIQVYTSKGVTYFGRDESLNQEFLKNVSSWFVILVKSKKFEEENPDLHQATCIYFMSLVEEQSQNTKYVVVDLDLDYAENKHSTMFTNITVTTCLRMKEGKTIDPDLYKYYLCQVLSNFIKVTDDVKFDNNAHIPGNRIVLKMTCPGFTSNTCSSKKQVWNCFFCKQIVEYDFVGYFYCDCGKVETTSCEYRCHDCRHGSSFISASKNFLDKELSVLKPFPEVNILIMGQTGVGKSTWINSIVNYVNYDSLNDGRQKGVICTIPIRFTYYDSEGKEFDVRLGDPNDGEVLVTGQSATQYCRTYCFNWNDKYFRIIDTPGIGDVRGIDKDKENMRHVIDYISHLKEVNGVCLLIKANETKIHAVFSYCLKELLVHLHKDIAKNIVFCFTNARNSFYSPGQTSVLVRKLLSDLKIENQLSLGPYNSFCLDNEAFLFLCMLQYPEIQFPQQLIKDFEQSWNISLKETYRLFETILGFKPHLLSQTLSLCTTRNKILLLSKPLAEISKTIQMNVRAIEQYKNEIETTEKTVQELQNNLYYQEVHLSSVNLPKPRTVCTNAKCVNRFQIRSLGHTETEYKTHCHVDCRLQNVTPKTTNNQLLKRCFAMNKSGICNNCGCSWEAHMHMLTEQKRIIKKVKCKFIEEDLNKNLTLKENKAMILKNLEDKIDEYKKEQEIITKTSVNMGMFLKKNAISIYNDSISDYLQYIIEETERNPHKTNNDRELLKHLKDTLAIYNKEIEILQKVLEEGGDSNYAITAEVIDRMEKELYSLKLTGGDLEKYVKNQRLATNMYIKYSEIQVATPKVLALPNAEKNDITSCLKTVKNYMVKKAKNITGKLS